MNVSFIGSGNLAWHLAPALDNTDFAVKEVYSQHSKNASALVDRLYQGRIKDSLDFSDSNSRIFIIAVTDDAIEQVAREIVLPPNAILVHTSGSKSLQVLDEAGTTNIGVFYPLQTFTKSQKIDFREVPVFIESDNPETEKVLMAMAKSITRKCHKISSETRLALHVGAVFASNFTTYMLTLSKEILKEHKLNFDLVKPLIVESINKSLSIGPEKAQTGPAKRGDLEVLDRHIDFLQKDESIAEIYKVISQHIIDRYS